MSREERGTLRMTAILTIAQLVVGAVAGAITGTFRAQAEVRAVARDVVNEQWLISLQDRTTQIAAHAAREAAERAIRESVTPQLIEMRAHVAKDDERQVRADQRQDRTEAEIRELQRQRR